MRGRETPVGRGPLTGEQIKPPRDRNVGSTSVHCPTCGAQPGEPCVTSTGGKCTGHPTRRRMAIRAENDSYSLADVLYARAVRPSERVALRKAAGLTETELAKLIGAGRGQLRAFEERLMFPRGATGAAYGCWLREQRRAS